MRIGGAKWNRELAAFASLYKWAVGNHHVRQNPVTMTLVVDRDGETATVPISQLAIAYFRRINAVLTRLWWWWTASAKE